MRRPKKLQRVTLRDVARELKSLTSAVNDIAAYVRQERQTDSPPQVDAATSPDHDNSGETET